MIEESLSGSFNFARFFPGCAATIHHGMEGEGQQVHGGEHHRQIFLAMAKIMFDMIAIVFQDIETFILNLPSRSTARNEFNDIVF